MRVLPLDAPSTTAGIGTHSRAQHLPNSPEALPTGASEQHPPSRGRVVRKTAIKDGMTGTNRTQLLSGWKEIASYMHQGVRTVQRWEAIGLPVRRVRAAKPSPVIAFTEDLDSWASSLRVPLLDKIAELTTTISLLEVEIRTLKKQLRMKNATAQMDETPTSHADTQLFQNDPSASQRRNRSNNVSRPTLDDSYGSVT